MKKINEKLISLFCVIALQIFVCIGFHFLERKSASIGTKLIQIWICWNNSGSAVDPDH